MNVELKLQIPLAQLSAVAAAIGAALGTAPQVTMTPVDTPAPAPAEVKSGKSESAAPAAAPAAAKKKAAASAPTPESQTPSTSETQSGAATKVVPYGESHVPAAIQVIVKKNDPDQIAQLKAVIDSFNHKGFPSDPKPAGSAKNIGDADLPAFYEKFDALVASFAATDPAEEGLG